MIERESEWTVGPGRFRDLTPGMRSWITALALANKLAQRSGLKHKVRGYRMSRGTWAYSVVLDEP